MLLDTSGQHQMLAGEALQQDAVLLQVPERLFMTASTALKSSACGKLIRAAELTEWQALVLHLLCERAAGADSFWAPYVAVLGDQSHHPLLWPAEVQGQLQGSAMLRTLQSRLQAVQEDTQLLIAAGANDLDIAAAWQQHTQTPLVSSASVCWAAAVLLGRSFALDLSEPDLPCEGDMSYYGSWQAHGPASLALVPWADMCRHSSDAGEDSMLLFDPEGRTAVLAAHRPYEPGQEVFDSHGRALSWADLLMDHGCIGEGSSDHPRYDALLGAHLQPRGPRNAALLEALTGLTGGPPAASLAPGGPDAMALALVRAGVASDGELVAAGWRTGSRGGDVGLCGRVMGRLGVPQSLATEARVVGVLAAAVDEALAGYPTSLAADQQELAALQQQQQQQQLGAAADGGGQGPQQQQQQLRVGVLRALISEKTALVGSRGVLRGWQQQLAALGAAPGPVKPAQLAAVYGGGDDE